MSQRKLKDSQTLLTASLFEKIRYDIVHGEFQPGDKLNESVLARENNVSRTPVREALKQLVIEGFVENIPNRGFVVIGITPQDFKDIAVIRRAIRRVAIQWSVKRMTEQELASLKDIYDLMEFYTMKKDLQKVFGLITQFHETIYRAIKSPYLEKVLINIQWLTQTFRYESLNASDRLEGSLEEHRQILEAFQTRDTDKVLSLLDAHGQHLEKIFDSL